MSPAVLLPLMTEPQPDTAERVRREMQAIPFALPEKMLRRTGLKPATRQSSGITIPSGSPAEADFSRVCQLGAFSATAAAPKDTKSGGGKPCP